MFSGTFVTNGSYFLKIIMSNYNEYLFNIGTTLNSKNQSIYSSTVNIAHFRRQIPWKLLLQIIKEHFSFLNLI